MTELREDLFATAEKHAENPRLVWEILLLAATTCLSAGMTPEQGGSAFNEILAEAYRVLKHKDLNPLAPVVRSEV